jgi:hypothetical protein
MDAAAGTPLLTVEGSRTALLEQGWARFPGVVEPGARRRLLDRDGGPWVPLAPKVGVVEQEGWYCQPPLDHLPDAVRAFAAALAAALRAELGDALPWADGGSFNEVTWGRQTPEQGRIGPHRDQAFYTGVLAVVTLQGAAPFSILASRDPRVPVATWWTEPGDLVLLRGAGLGGPEARCPWHDVGRPAAGERVTLTFRHTVRTPGGWEDDGRAERR